MPLLVLLHCLKQPNEGRARRLVRQLLPQLRCHCQLRNLKILCWAVPASCCRLKCWFLRLCW